jgi:phage gpG-like protein
MMVTVNVTRDAITPRLGRMLARVSDARPALEAAGLAIRSQILRAFDDPGIRPAPWQALAASTLAAKERDPKIKFKTALLKAEGTMWQSIAIHKLTKSSVTIGTDRDYARFHQMGTRYMPARPFFPIDRSGRLTDLAKRRVQEAIKIKLRVLE